MVPFNYTELIDALAFLMKDNLLRINRIDEAVESILRVKSSMNLLCV